MAMFDWLKTERQKYGTHVRRTRPGEFAALPRFDEKSRELFGKGLPRGALLARLDPDRERMNFFMSPNELLRQHRYETGQLIMGKLGNRYLGHLDDRPMVTIAGARAGKTSTVLEPNLYVYPGSALVIDPKGEIAVTALFRRAIGHDVYVLDAFGQSGLKSACFNPLAELDPDNPNIIDDVLSIASAIVPEGGEGNSKHFNDSARTLIAGLILLTFTLPRSERHFITVRELLCLTYGPLADAAKMQTDKAIAEASGDEKAEYFNRSKTARKFLFNRMVSTTGRFGGVLAAIGSRFEQTPQGEMGSILSTAAAHTDFLDSLPLRAILRRSDFKLSTLRGDRPATIYLCLPVGRMTQHGRWLRIMIQLACAKLESMGRYPRSRPGVLFMMEEFATLGHLPLMENAAAYFPGFGVKLWVVLQDVTQLQRHYRASWESFVGNSGLVQLFANGDEATLKYEAARLGKLIEPYELRAAFSRERASQLLLMQGEPAAAALRLEHADVDSMRARAEVFIQSHGSP